LFCQYNIRKIDTENLEIAFDADKTAVLDRNVESVFFYGLKFCGIDLSRDWTAPVNARISRKELIFVLGTYGLSEADIKLYRESIDKMIEWMPFVDLEIIEVPENHGAFGRRVETLIREG
jgi:hypothetical protein